MWIDPMKLEKMRVLLEYSLKISKCSNVKFL